MDVGPIRELAGTWRDEAERLRHRGLEREAVMAESFASDLESALHEWLAEALTISEAAEESGYSESSIRQRLASGELPNAGEKGRPRIRRADLPTKGGTGLRTVPGDLADRVLRRRLASPHGGA